MSLKYRYAHHPLSTALRLWLKFWDKISFQILWDGRKVTQGRGRREEREHSYNFSITVCLGLSWPAYEPQQTTLNTNVGLLACLSCGCPNLTLASACSSLMIAVLSLCTIGSIFPAPWSQSTSFLLCIRDHCDASFPVSYYLIFFQNELR